MRRFLFRWGLIVFGLFAMFSGARELLVGERLDEVAQVISPAQAQAVTADDKPHFVRLDAQIDPSTRIYSSNLAEPRYVALDTTRQHVLDPSATNAQKMVGQSVSITGTLDLRVAELQTIEVSKSDGEDEGTLRGLRLFVPIMESSGSIVLMSPGIYSHDDPDYDHWLAQATHTGVVSRLNDLATNKSSLEKGGADVREVFASMGIQLAPDAVIVLTDMDGTRYPARSYAPLAGSANSIFVEITHGTDPSTYPITGMIRSANVSAYPGFADALGQSIPARFSIVDLGSTAADINAQNVANAKTALTVGTFFAAIGGFWVLLRRKTAIKRARLVAKELDDLDYINECGKLENFEEAA